MIFNILTNILNKKFLCSKQQKNESKKEIFWKRIYYVNFKYENFKETPTEKMKNFFNLTNDLNSFKINPVNNKYLTRMFENNIKKLKSNKEWDLLEELIDKKNDWFIEAANKFTKTLWNDYKNVIYECFNDDRYPAEFVCLILNEILTKTYVQQLKNDKIITIVKKREPHKTIEGYITLNKFMVQYIYDNGEAFKSFKDLYFCAIKNFRKSHNEIPVINNIETFGLGRWLLFQNDKNNSANSEKIAQILYSIIQSTNMLHLN